MKCINEGFKFYYESDDGTQKSAIKDDITKYELGFTLDEAIRTIAEWEHKVYFPNCFERDPKETITAYKIDNEEEYNKFINAAKTIEIILAARDIFYCNYDEKENYYIIKLFKENNFNCITKKEIISLHDYLKELIHVYNIIGNEISNIQDVLKLKIPEACNGGNI